MAASAPKFKVDNLVEAVESAITRVEDEKDEALLSWIKASKAKIKGGVGEAKLALASFDLDKHIANVEANRTSGGIGVVQIYLPASPSLYTYDNRIRSMRTYLSLLELCDDEEIRLVGPFKGIMNVLEGGVA